MAVLYYRYPRYSTMLSFLVLLNLYLLSPLSRPSPSTPGSGWSSMLSPFTTSQLTMQLKRAEEIYQDMKRQRYALVNKWSPLTGAEGIEMFPEDTSPWPPYTVWDFFPPAFSCPHQVTREGALGNGGKWLCGLDRVKHKKDCVVYSFGINHESSFEASVLAKTSHCKVYGYDFSVDSFGPEVFSLFAPSSESHRQQNETFQQQQQQHHHHNRMWDRIKFFKYGLADEDGLVKISDGDQVEVEMFTLESLMRMNGHDHIDILKIDIEGWEFNALSAFFQPYSLPASKAHPMPPRPLPIGQMQLELHLWNTSFPALLKWWETLEDVGLRPFWAEPNLVYQNYHPDRHSELAEYAFLNVRGRSEFIRG